MGEEEEEEWEEVEQGVGDLCAAIIVIRRDTSLGTSPYQ